MEKYCNWSGFILLSINIEILLFSLIDISIFSLSPLHSFQFSRILHYLSQLSIKPYVLEKSYLWNCFQWLKIYIWTQVCVKETKNIYLWSSVSSCCFIFSGYLGNKCIYFFVTIDLNCNYSNLAIVKSC